MIPKSGYRFSEKDHARLNPARLSRREPKPEKPASRRSTGHATWSATLASQRDVPTEVQERSGSAAANHLEATRTAFVAAPSRMLSAATVRQNAFLSSLRGSRLTRPTSARSRLWTVARAVSSAPSLPGKRSIQREE